MKEEIVWEFPQPTKLIEATFALLAIARGDDEEAKRALPPSGALARPWDPPSCPARLQQDLWIWFDAVVAWLNREYTWQADQAIPSCWPSHPNLVHEIAVLASLRVSIGYALTPDPMEDWHRYVVPGFFTRMTARFGGSPCQPAQHRPWPGKSRFTEYLSDAEVDKRTRAFAGAPKRGHQQAAAGGPPAPPRRAARPELVALNGGRESESTP